MRVKKRIFTCFVVLLMVTFCCIGCNNEKCKDAASNSTQDKKVEETKEVAGNEFHEDDLVILYTTDIHKYPTQYIGYDGVSSYKKAVENICGEEEVTLVDCGDCLGDGEIAQSTSGSAIIDIMNKVGYDVAVPGNHDFQYGVENCKELAKKAKFAYLCCNLRERSTENTVLSDYSIVEMGDKKVAFIGATTPVGAHSYVGCDDFAASRESTEVNPNAIYDFMATMNVTEYNPDFEYDYDTQPFYQKVQDTIDEVNNQGVDYVVMLTHLGCDSEVCSSRELIAKTSGIDAVIDGHAHVEIENEQIDNKNGEKVTLTSAGYYLMNLGQLIIDKNGNITTKLIPMKDYLDKDAEITQYINNLAKNKQ